MKKTLLPVLFVLTYSYSFCQTAYWQQTVNYKIDVSLNDTAKTLDGYIRMQYFNNSPDTLRFIWIHTWPNAYKNDRTAFSDQLLENGRTDFYFSNDDKRGYMNRLDFKVEKNTASTEDHPQYQDIVKLLLPSPLAPGDSIHIETAFHVKLPYNFSRGGYIGKSFQITQWYPKPAVYDKKGWHEMPYLDQGEFYSEFGEFEVSITLPKDYVVAATGLLKNETDNGLTKTLEYSQANIHDFAWFADKDFTVMHDTVQLATHTVDVYLYCNKSKSDRWKKGTDYIKSALTTKSNWVGEYPYSIASVVAKPGKGSGGMEYPTITLIDDPGNEKELDFVINHEVGHNWFYGILGSNERQHPWMDEGMNSYYDRRYYQEKYCINGVPLELKSLFLQKRLPDDIERSLLKDLAKKKIDQPIETPSEKFAYYNYGFIPYRKTADWMGVLRSSMGDDVFDSFMHRYFDQWKFKHPYPEDFKSLAEQSAGKNLDSVFSYLNKKGDLQFDNAINCKTDQQTNYTGKKIKFASFFSAKNADKYNYIFVSPALGYNSYDKFMAGLLLHNYTLPSYRFQFILAPLYATNSKTFNGIGNLNFNSYMNGKIKKFTIGITAAKFSTKESLDTLDHKVFEDFHKFVPSLQLYFSHQPRSTVTSWIDLRTFLISEKRFSMYDYKAGSDSTVSYPTSSGSSNRYINQVSFNLENSRTLYPYDYQLKLQQGKGFYRFDLQANYFFNYAKWGGMRVRLFATKFGYIGNNTYDAYLYRPKLLAATGEEDYTYSNYFIGRSAATSNPDKPVKNLGLGGHQLMIRDGGFKLRLDQFDFIQGRTENWLAAMNFNTTLPDLFPVRLPLRLFFDAGTYAEGWEKDAQTSKFLYVGGLQLSLFKNLLDVYAPLIYSKDFKTTLKSQPDQNTFFKRLTFSINIQNITTRKLFPKIPL